jgi:hypothetical protein
MAQKILLVTTLKWPSAPRVAGAFASLGCRVEGVFPSGHMLQVSRYLSRGHPYRPLRPLSSIAAAITAANPDLVVPCDDRAVRHLLTLHATAPSPEFSVLLAHSLGNLDSYPILMARSRAIAAAQAEGIVAPLTLPVVKEAELSSALVTIGFPAVLKADESWGGDSVVIVHTQEEACRALRKLTGPPSRLRSVARSVLRKDAHFLHAAWAPKAVTVHVQRFIFGKPATSAFACRDGAVLAALHVDVIDWRGATGPARLIKRVQCSEMDEAARRIARRFALNGLHGLDFVRDESGVAHLIEVNPRATQICHLVLGTGNDMVAALAGERPRPVTTDLAAVALFPQAWDHDLKATQFSGVYEDVPWDDPAVLRVIAEDRFMVEPAIRTAAARLRPQNARS